MRTGPAFDERAKWIKQTACHAPQALRAGVAVAFSASRPRECRVPTVATAEPVDFDCIGRALWSARTPQEIPMKKSGSAEWKGGLRDGGGTISTETGVLRNAPYGFK